MKTLRFGNKDTFRSKWLAAVALTFVCADALAKDPRDEIQSKCGAEIEKYCAGAEGRGQLRCLKQNESKLGDVCAKAFTHFKLGFPQAAGNGVPKEPQEGGGSLDEMAGRAGMMGGARSPTISYAGGWYSPDSSPSSVEYHRGRAATPVYSGERDTISLSAGGDNLHFGDTPHLASGVQIPYDFYRVDFGLQYSRRLKSGSVTGAQLNAGSASDKPFASSDVTTYGVGGFYSFSSSESSRWALSLNLSNNSPLANSIPIPGVMYIYHTKTFVGTFGFPHASIQWRPVEPWSFSFSLMAMLMNGEVAYGNRKNIQGFVGYNSNRQSYLRSDRTNEEDRFTYDEKRVLGGLRFPIFSTLRGEFQGGYAFDRSIYEGKRSISGSTGDVQHTLIDDSWFAGWNLQFNF